MENVPVARSTTTVTSPLAQGDGPAASSLDRHRVGERGRLEGSPAEPVTAATRAAILRIGGWSSRTRTTTSGRAPRRV